MTRMQLLNAMLVKMWNKNKKKSQVKTLKNSSKGARFHEVVDNEPENLLKYELLHRYFSKILSRFP